MSNIYLNTEQKSRPPRPEHGNNCNGHFTSIANGGNGHSIGDGCGCDGLNPTANIDFIAPLIMLSAFIIIILKQKTKRFIGRRFY